MEPVGSENQNNSELLIYQTKSGLIQVNLKLDREQETLWAMQKQIAEIFETTKQNIRLHIQSIFDTEELRPEATVKKSLTVQIEGNRAVSCELELYNLDMMIAIGYRVNSKKATQFRIWATKILQEYIIKGFVMNDERLKNPKKSKQFVGSAA